jgi:hypothetical protein
VTVPEQRGWVGLLLVSAIAVLAGAARTARADEDDPRRPVRSRIHAWATAVPAASAGATAPQPTGPPQPGNAPPAQAPPPAQMPPSNPPPPGYAPPPGYPPPYYYYPPPQPLGWYYSPAPLPIPPKAPRLKRAFLALPYFGVHTYQNSEASAYDPGLRFGSLLGGRLNDRLSLNADLTVDISNAGRAGGAFREYSIALSFAPMLQLPARLLEIVVGPKVGLFILNTETTSGGGRFGGTQPGVVFGIDAGVFLSVSPTTSMGVLLAFEFRQANDACETTFQVGLCASGAASGLASIVGLTAAVLF